MKGVVPVFISCKNGIIPGDELYKLNTVAEQFGSEYARKVLVATDMGKAAKSRKYFLERARDMGIQIIEDVHKKWIGKLENIIENHIKLSENVNMVRYTRKGLLKGE